MTPSLHTTGVRDFYTPGTSVSTDGEGRIERFVNAIYRTHRFRGGVTARSE